MFGLDAYRVKIKKENKTVLLNNYKKIYYIICIYINLILSTILGDKNGKMKNKQEHIIQGIIIFKSLLLSIKDNKEKSIK